MRRRGSGAKGPTDSELEPEVEAFAKWFADWWLRRGSRLSAAATKADSTRFKDEVSNEKNPPLRWDEKSERIVLATEREPDRRVDYAVPSRLL